MPSRMRHWMAVVGLALAAVAAHAQPASSAQAPAPQATTQQAPRQEGSNQPPSQLPPAAPLDAPAAAGSDAAAPLPLPRPEDTNAQRAISQPRNNAPFWRGVRESGHVPGSVNNHRPYSDSDERGVLIQRFVDYPGSNFASAGEAWRQVRNRWILPYGGALLIITLLALAMFYWRKGTIKVHSAPTGRMIERFTYFERASHWINAIAFVLLAISGIFIAFGKAIILPIVGHHVFGFVTYGLKNVHNFVGPLFAVSLAVMFFAYLRDNWPHRDDIKWLKKGGGLLTGEHVPSHRFNAGEKIVFWGGVLFFGSIIVGSGFVLDKIVPGLDSTRGGMQIAHMVHAIAAVLMMAMISAHAYLGTIGMEGAYKAMRNGYVDESWAKEHHEYWYRDIKAGKIPAQRTSGAEHPVEVKPQH